MQGAATADLATACLQIRRWRRPAAALAWASAGFQGGLVCRAAHIRVQLPLSDGVHLACSWLPTLHACAAGSQHLMLVQQVPNIYCLCRGRDSEGFPMLICPCRVQVLHRAAGCSGTRQEATHGPDGISVVRAHVRPSPSWPRCLTRSGFTGLQASRPAEFAGQAGSNSPGGAQM